MAMDFFESQDVARKKTGWLVVLFVLAIIVIMVLVYVAVALVVLWYQTQSRSGDEISMQLLFSPALLAGVGLGTIGVVGGASAFKLVQLRGGGETVALALGGRHVPPGTDDPQNRKLLNVVEEMAIASGTPVPPVYMMVEEPGINAFAAGYGPSSAVIGVTRGAVEQLSRDELQGVIAHEFSHILNGDMRLNIRLIGVLFGILVIGLVGGTILRTAAYSSRATSSRSKGGGAAPILVLGLALMIIGYAGLFFGRLIKAAVSRQREYLADAAAAQFTRYPDGIAGALKKIGGWVDGSRMRSPRAEEASHMYFGQGVRSITGLLATHPPLKKRIGRLDPQWDGSFPKLQRQRPTRETARGEAKRRVPEKAEALLGAAVAAAGATAVGQVGRPTQDHITYAAELIEQLPDAVREAAHEPYGGRAVVYALLLDDDQAIRQAQLERLAEQADEQVFSETKRLSPIVDGIDETARLPLIDLVLPALQTMAAEQYDAFKSNVDALVEADERVDVFEWALRRIILKYLEPRFRKMRPTVVQYYSLKGVRDECAVLLSRLAHAGNRDDRNAAERAFRTGSAHLRLGPLTLLKAEECAFPALNAALDRLAEVTPRLKKTVLEACAASISHDREITVREGELFRGVADALECPVPLLLPGQPLI